MTQDQTPAPTAGRPPVRPRDWSAIGLTRPSLIGARWCPVGIVESVDETSLRLRLVSALTGEPMDEIAVIRWADVGGYVVVPHEAGSTDRDGHTVMPDQPLWEFQTRWTRRAEAGHTDQHPEPDPQRRRLEEMAEQIRAEGGPDWSVRYRSIADTFREHGVDPEALS